MSDVTDTTPPAAAPRPRPRWRRILKWTLIGGASLLVLALVALWLVLANLGAGPIKRRVQAIAHSSAGVDIDYGDGSVSLFSGLVLHDLRVASAPADQALAPNLVRVGELRVGWSLGGLLRRTVREFAVHDVSLTVVQDEDGSTSPARWNVRRVEIAPPAKPPVVPLSHLMQAYLPPKPAGVEHMTVDGVHATILRVRDGKPFEQLLAGNLALTGHVRAGAGRLDFSLDAGTEAAPLIVKVLRQQLEAGAVVAGSDRLLEVHPWMKVAADEQSLSVSFDAPVTRHELVPHLPSGSLAAGVLRVRFDPPHARTLVELERFSFLDGAATAASSIELLDAVKGVSGLVVRKMAAHAALDVLAARLKDFIPDGTVIGPGALDLHVADLVLSGDEAEAAKAGATPIPYTPMVIAAGGELKLEAALDEVETGKGAARIHARKFLLTMRGADGKAELGGGLARAEVGAAAHPQTEVEAVSWKGTVSPGEDGRIALHLELPVGHAALHGASPLDLRGASMELTGLASTDGSKFDGELSATLGAVRASAGGTEVAVNDARVRLGLDEVDYHVLDPRASSAGVTLKGHIGSMTAKTPKLLAHLDGIGLELATHVADATVHYVVMKLPIEHVSLDGAAGGPRLAPTRARFDLDASHLNIDQGHPARSVVKLKALVEAGPLSGHADLDKQADAMTFDVAMHLDRLGPLVELARGSLPRDLGVPWEALGFSLESKGSVHGLARPMEASIEHRTHAVVRGLAMRRNTADFSARTIDLRFASHGTVARHDFDAALDLDSPRFGSVGGKGHEAVSLKGSYDFGKPRLDVQLASSGDVGPDGELALTADYDAPAERLAWKVSGKLDRLGLIGLLMPSALAQQHQVAWDKLGLEAHGEGQFTSLVKRFAPGLPPRAVLATDPLETMRGALTLDLTAKGLDYRGPDGAALLLPAFGGHLAAKADEGKLHADISLDMPSVNAHASGHKVDGEKLATTLVVDSEGTTENGSIRVQYGLSAGVIHQDAAPIYPLGDLKLNVVARADAKGSVRVEQAHFENLAGGTRLDLKGGVDLRPLGVRPDLRKTERVLAQAFSAGSWIPGRRNLIVEGELSQKLDRLNDPGQLRGRGTVSVPFQIESGNLTYVRASAKLGFTDVDLELPKSGLSVAGLNGLVPLSQDLVISPEGAVTPLFGATTTAYSRLRFSDHQPFMTGNPYLTARSIKLAQPDNKQHPEPLSVGPLAGNLRIDRNLIALDQFEADLGGGRVTGQVLVDYEGQDTEVSFHGAISGVRTEGEHERLDANAAISLLPLRRILEGRIEVVHLGRSHLERLLDLYDPYQADVSANRGRQALKVGYPRQVRLRFHEGFGSLALEMGGLASAVRIDEINGIPMGPILERYLAPRKPEAEIQ